MTKIRAKTLVNIAVCAALICVCSLISVPFAVPLTMQTFAVFFALFYLESWGAVAVLVYVAVGSVGLPVFSGFVGGIGHLFGLTGGFISGFIVASLAYIIALRLRLGVMMSSTIALLCVYAVGTVQFVLVSGASNGIFSVLLSCVIPFVIPDIIKIFLAYKLSKRLKGMTRK